MGDTLNVTAEVGAEKSLYAFGDEGVEEDFVTVPYRSGNVEVEIDAEVADVVCIEPVVRIYVADHKSLLVSLISVSCHRNPGDVPAVSAPYGIGVIAAAHADLDSAAALDIINVDVGVGAEGVFLTRLFAAGVYYVASVGRPVELLYAAERFGWELVRFVSEYVHGVLLADKLLAQRCHIAAGSFGNPVVPVTVHQVLCGVGTGLVEGRIAVRRGTYCLVFDGTGVDDAALVRGKLELGDAVRHIAEFHLPAQLA